MSECSWCATALALATKGHISAVVQGTVQPHTHTSVDAVELARWIRQFHKSKALLKRPTDGGDLNTAFDTEADASEKLQDDVDYALVIILDLSRTEPLFLDQYKQAVSMPDMVLAIQTQSANIPLDYRCNQKPLYQNNKDVTRQVLAALLSQLWGVVPSDLRPLLDHSEAREDLTWAIGPTPFGDISQSRVVNVLLRDVVHRNAVYAKVHVVLEEMRQLLLEFMSTGVEVNDLPAKFQGDFMLRWNLFKLKQERIEDSLSSFEYADALADASSMQHDVHAMHYVLDVIARASQQQIVCPQVRSQFWPRVLVYSMWTMVSVLVAVVIRRNLAPSVIISN
eukprot:TRINITY_DN1840_c0_g1_i4.p2 TRINITY_DN1840_c0_g1~~TRINITY_DN1840_c0_g1_i4.p2  ORF type:complete len:338 (+),score=74.91 TRINITY_DN1840_c0_g1_i4:1249-2262(+)